MREVLQATVNILGSGKFAVLCSLIETKGSTPQKPGASMLVLPDGSQIGTLGGGCVEAEVKQRSLQATTHDTAVAKSELLVFHLDNDYGWDDGLICGGRMTILAQPLVAANRDAVDYFQTFHQLVESGIGCTEAVTLAPTSTVPAGTRFLFDAQNNLIRSWSGLRAPNEVIENLPNLTHRPRPSARHGVCYLPFLPRIRLLIVGAGHVGQAVGKLATEADFDVWVLDDRQIYANRERFPLAERILVGDHAAELARLSQTDVTPSTYCLIVTRGHNHDEEALYHLVNTPAAYVGMIGSKRKIKLIFEDLLAKGITRSALKRVHAPLGLNIGSQTVPEIAISIVAELIALRNLGAVPPGMRNFVDMRFNGACLEP